MKPKPGDKRTGKCKQCDNGILTRVLNYTFGQGFYKRDREPTTCPYCNGTQEVVEQFQGDGSGGFWTYFGPADQDKHTH